MSPPFRFGDVDWAQVPDQPGVYVISDLAEIIYVGMAGRNGRGCLRKRLRDHASGQVVNMFAQYLFLARVKFTVPDRITHPRDAARACRDSIRSRCSFQYVVTTDGGEARALEQRLKGELTPALNP